MPLPPKSPDSPDLIFICGLGWPKMERYYLSRRCPGCRDFWVLPYGEEKAPQVFARLDEAYVPETEIALDALDFYLQTHHKMQRPEEGAYLEGLLTGAEITIAIGALLLRSREKHGEMHSDMLGIMADSMDRDEYDELMERMAKGQDPERPSARVLLFPPPDFEDEGEVN